MTPEIKALEVLAVLKAGILFKPYKEMTLDFQQKIIEAHDELLEQLENSKQDKRKMQAEVLRWAANLNNCDVQNLCSLQGISVGKLYQLANEIEQGTLVVPEGSNNG